MSELWDPKPWMAWGVKYATKVSPSCHWQPDGKYEQNITGYPAHVRVVPGRELGLIDDPDAHYPHDFGSDGRCRTKGCDIWDPTENDDDIEDNNP